MATASSSVTVLRAGPETGLRVAGGNVVAPGRRIHVPGLQESFETPGRCDQQQVSFLRLCAFDHRCGPVEIENQDCVKKTAVSGCGFNRAGQSAENHEPVRQACQGIDDLFGSDVRMRARYPHCLAVVVPGDHALTRHPSVGAVFVTHAVLHRELQRAVRKAAVESVADLFEVCRVDSLEPFLGSGSAGAGLESQDRMPPGGEMDPIGSKVPIPQPVICFLNNQIVRVHVPAVPPGRDRAVLLSAEAHQCTVELRPVTHRTEAVQGLVAFLDIPGHPSNSVGAFVDTHCFC